MPKYSGSSGSSGSSNETKPPVVNPGKSVSMNSIFEASNRVKNYIEKNNAIPKTLTIGSTTYSINDFLYLLSKAIVNRNSGVTTAVSVLSTSAPSSPSGNNKLGKLYKAEFVSIAKNLANYYTTNKKAPNYVSSSLGNLQYQSTIYIFSRIGAYIYNNKNAIPNYVEVTVNSNSKINKDDTGGSNPNPTPSPTTSLLGSNNNGKVEFIGAYGNTKSNKKIAYVIGIHPLENKVHTALLESIIKKTSSLNYCYYIYKITVTENADDFDKSRENGQILARDFVLPHIKTKDFDLVVDIHSNQGTVGGNYEETNFIFAPRDKGISKKIAEDLISQIPDLCYYYPDSQTSPPFLTEPLVDAGINTIIYETYMYESEAITYTLIEQLINSVDKYNFDSLNEYPSNNTHVSLTSIKDAAKRVETYVRSTGGLPNVVAIDGKNYKMEEFLYLLSAAIVNINKGSSESIKFISVKAPSRAVGDSIYGVFTKSQFVTLATNVYNYILNNGQAPNYATSNFGRVRFESLIYQFSKILTLVDLNNNLPNNVTFDNVGTQIPGDEFIVINNSNYTSGPTSVKYNNKYLISTGRCSCGEAGDYHYHTSVFKNYCPCCKNAGYMIYEEASQYPEGMWVCLMCDADFCLVVGKEHINGSTKYLTKTVYTQNNNIPYIINQIEYYNSLNVENNNTIDNNGSNLNNNAINKTNNESNVSSENNSQINNIGYNFENEVDYGNIEYINENLNNINNFTLFSSKEEDYYFIQ